MTFFNTETDLTTDINMTVTSKEKSIQYCDLKEGEYFLNKDSKGIFTLCKKLDEDEAAVIKGDFTNISSGDLLDVFGEIIPIEECYFYPCSDFVYRGCNKKAICSAFPWIEVKKEDLNPGDMFLYANDLFMLLNTENSFNCLRLCECVLDIEDCKDITYSIGKKELVLKLKSVSIKVIR